MPPKVKQLILELERSGIVNRSGKGSHLNFVHPNLATAVFEELCTIAEEAIELYREDGKPLPLAASGRDLANKMQHVA